MKAQTFGLQKRILNFEFMKTSCTRCRIATEQLEPINIIEAIEMVEAVKKLFERVSKDEMNNFIDSAIVARRGVKQEADFVRHHRRRFGPSHSDS